MIRSCRDLPINEASYLANLNIRYYDGVGEVFLPPNGGAGARDDEQTTHVQMRRFSDHNTHTRGPVDGALLCKRYKGDDKQTGHLITHGDMYTAV